MGKVMSQKDFDAALKQAKVTNPVEFQREAQKLAATQEEAPPAVDGPTHLADVGDGKELVCWEFNTEAWNGTGDTLYKLINLFDGAGRPEIAGAIKMVMQMITMGLMDLQQDPNVKTYMESDDEGDN